MKPSDQQDEAQNKEGKSEKDQEGSPPCTGNADNEAATIALVFGLSLVILYVILKKQKWILKSKRSNQEGINDWDESQTSTPRTEYTISGSTSSGQSSSTAEEEGTAATLSESLLALYNLIMSCKTSTFQDKVENQQGNDDDDGEATRTSSSLSDGTISNSTSSDPSSTAEVRSKGLTLRRSVLFLHDLILQNKNSDGEMKAENQEGDREGPRTSSTGTDDAVSSSTYSGRSSISKEGCSGKILSKRLRSIYNFVTDTKSSEQQDEAENKEGKSEEDREGSPPSTGTADKEGEE
ncbi:secreted protein C-like [Argiope bruennichi]|uniref:secreted protein C-like n=1 Tax=Argiope bruennichi TaxID=94029 RepID=UPI0024952448|nr:secreted protein C-like [Argiope bruennichi]